MESATVEGIMRIPARGITTTAECITADSACWPSQWRRTAKGCAALTKASAVSCFAESAGSLVGSFVYVIIEVSLVEGRPILRVEQVLDRQQKLRFDTAVS